MRSVLGEVLPLALVVAVSPLNIIPSILLLFSARPRRTATAFLAGFLAGVGLVLGVLIVLVAVLDLKTGTTGSNWTTVIRGALGTYLIVAGVRKFRERPRGEDQAALPGWMDSLSSASPWRAMEVGTVLGAANPKNLVVAMAAAVVVSTAGLSGTQQIISCSVYVAVAAAGVAAPIVAVLLLGDRSGPVLEDWHQWLKENNTTVMAVLFFVFGVVLVGQAIAGR